MTLQEVSSPSHIAGWGAAACLFITSLADHSNEGITSLTLRLPGNIPIANHASYRAAFSAAWRCIAAKLHELLARNTVLENLTISIANVPEVPVTFGGVQPEALQLTAAHPPMGTAADWSWVGEVESTEESLKAASALASSQVRLAVLLGTQRAGRNSPLRTLPKEVLWRIVTMVASQCRVQVVRRG